MMKLLTLLRYARGPVSTWNIATNGERVAMVLMAAFLLADVVTFSVFDMVFDVASMVVLYLYIWDAMEFDG